jgi:hypothetical protein
LSDLIVDNFHRIVFCGCIIEQTTRGYVGALTRSGELDQIVGPDRRRGIVELVSAVRLMSIVAYGETYRVAGISTSGDELSVMHLGFILQLTYVFFCFCEEERKKKEMCGWRADFRAFFSHDVEVAKFTASNPDAGHDHNIAVDVKGNAYMFGTRHRDGSLAFTGKKHLHTHKSTVLSTILYII